MRLVKEINGVKLFVSDATESIENYAHKKGLVNHKVFIIEDENEVKNYVLYDGRGVPKYVSQRMEDICCHIDILHIANTWR